MAPRRWLALAITSPVAGSGGEISAEARAHVRRPPGAAWNRDKGPLDRGAPRQAAARGRRAALRASVRPLAERLERLGRLRPTADRRPGRAATGRPQRVGGCWASVVGGAGCTPLRLDLALVAVCARNGERRGSAARRGPCADASGSAALRLPPLGGPAGSVGVRTGTVGGQPRRSPLP